MSIIVQYVCVLLKNVFEYVINSKYFYLYWELFNIVEFAFEILLENIVINIAISIDKIYSNIASWLTLVVRIFAGAVRQGKCSFLFALVLWFEPGVNQQHLSDEWIRARCPHPHLSRKSTVRRAESVL